MPFWHVTKTHGRQQCKRRLIYNQTQYIIATLLWHRNITGATVLTFYPWGSWGPSRQSWKKVQAVQALLVQRIQNWCKNFGRECYKGRCKLALMGDPVNIIAHIILYRQEKGLFIRLPFCIIKYHVRSPKPIDKIQSLAHSLIELPHGHSHKNHHHEDSNNHNWDITEIPIIWATQLVR